MSDYLRLIARRALTSADPGLLQVGFEVAVLDRYREARAYEVMRTDTVGRVKEQGGWSIDFGIARGDGAIHASWQALTLALPPDERAHWASHTAAGFDPSEMFLRMQLSPSSCFDDGELRPW
jgi:hypothetical protein